MAAMAIPVLHFVFGLIITALFCAAAVTAAKRAPRHLIWLGLISASSICSSAAGAVNLLFMNQLQQGKSHSELNGFLIAQGLIGGLGTLLMCVGAATLLVVLMNERPAAVAASEPWQNR